MPRDRRTGRMTLRVTEAEKRLYETIAEEVRLPLSDWVRDRLNEAADKHRKDHPPSLMSPRLRGYGTPDGITHVVRGGPAPEGMSERVQDIWNARAAALIELEQWAARWDRVAGRTSVLNPKQSGMLHRLRQTFADDERW